MSAWSEATWSATASDAVSNCPISGETCLSAASGEPSAHRRRTKSVPSDR